LDLSISSPGFAVIEVKDRKAHLIETAYVKTESEEDRVNRYKTIESFAFLFLRQQLKKGKFDAIVRETWPPSRNYENNDKIHGAWSAVDRALHIFRLSVNVNMSPTTIKKLVTGSGSATKEQVADAVRKWLRLPADFKFKTNDESDAASIALAYLIREKLIDEVR
jgi:crossover junction endodeoxyribonuclease RuvC